MTRVSLALPRLERPQIFMEYKSESVGNYAGQHCVLAGFDKNPAYLLMLVRILN